MHSSCAGSIPVISTSAGWCNGNTRLSDRHASGSSPDPAASFFPYFFLFFLFFSCHARTRTYTRVERCKNLTTWLCGVTVTQIALNDQF